MTARRDVPEPLDEYDRGVNTFSPEGRLFQVEYAIEAIKIGSTAVGISTSEGIVLAVEKRLLSPLQEASSVEKLAEIDSHIGCAMSGLSADARTLIDHARSESQYHRFTFNEPMKVDSLTQAVCDLALRFGESGEENTMSRPFGVALLVAGWDKHGPALYHTDPSGTFTRFDAKAIGAGSEARRRRSRSSSTRTSRSRRPRRWPSPSSSRCPLSPRRAARPAAPPRVRARRPAPAADAPRSLRPQVMEEKLDITNVEVAAVKMPPAKEAQPVTAACHYVPGGQQHPQYSVYTKEQLRDDHRPPRRPRVVGGAPIERASE